MKRLFFFLTIVVATSTTLFAQTDGFGIDVADPQEKLDVNGAVKIGTTTNTNDGTIRYTGSDFEGYNDGKWNSLTTKGSIVYAEDWDNNDTYSPGSLHDITGYSDWMTVQDGDILLTQFSLSCRLTGGSSIDDFDFRIYIDGTGGCGDSNTEYLFYRPDQNTDDHTNFKPVSYNDVIEVSCDGLMRFKLQAKNSGDDNFGVRDRSMVVTKFK